MAKQVLDVDRTRLGVQPQAAVRQGHPDLHVGEAGVIVGKPAFQWQAAVLVELQGRDAGHDLGHRCKSEHRIQRHWNVPGPVEISVGLVMNQLSVACNCHHRTRDAIRLDFTLEKTVHPRQALGGKSGVERRCAGQRVCDRGMNGEQATDQQDKFFHARSPGWIGKSSGSQWRKPHGRIDFPITGSRIDPLVERICEKPAAGSAFGISSAATSRTVKQDVGRPL